jgi:hypothetical protein
MDNYIETMDHWTRCRGRLAKLDYGEGFRQYMCHPYPTTPVLQDMLGHAAVHTVTARALVD